MDDPTERLITPTFIAITLSTFAYFMSLGSLLPTLPRFIEEELGGSSVAVGFGIGTFAIAAAILQLEGKAARGAKFGNRRRRE